MSNITIYRGIQNIFFFHTKLRPTKFRKDGMIYEAEFAILLFKLHFFSSENYFKCIKFCSYYVFFYLSDQTQFLLINEHIYQFKLINA